MKWVLASERLPAIRKRMPMKDEGNYTTGFLREEGFFITEYGTRKPHQIEWLDESQLSEGGEEKLTRESDINTPIGSENGASLDNIKSFTKLVTRIKRLQKRISTNKEYYGYDVKSMLYDLINPSTE